MAAEVIVFSEQPGLGEQLMSRATQLAHTMGWTVSAYRPLIGEGADTHDGSGSPASLPVPEAHGDLAAGCVGGLFELIGADTRLVLVGATQLGMEVGPRLAERCGAGYAPWALDLELTTGEESILATCMLFGGTGIASYRFRSRVTIATVADGVFAAEPSPGKVPEWLPLPLRQDVSPVKLLRVEPKAPRSAGIETASLLVDCGRGIKDLADLDAAKATAAALGAQVACSRPLSSERDWFVEWLGLSGVKSRPDLCLALGVSGAVQHMVGIRGARLIVAVNSDPDAAIFSQSDYGVVADLREFLPILADRLQKRGVRQASLARKDVTDQATVNGPDTRTEE